MESEKNQERSRSEEERLANNESFSSLSKIEIIKLLRGTIQRLEVILDRLETESIDNVPLSTLINNLLVTDRELKITFKNDRELNLAYQQKRINASRTANWIDSIANVIRSFLPRSWQDRLSNSLVVGIVSGAIIVLLSTSLLLLPQKSTEIAEKPENIPTPPEKIESIEQPIEKITEKESDFKSSEEIIQPSKSNSPNESKTQSETKIPEELETSSELEITEDFSSQPQLTPEQSLIVAIQDRTSEITNRYSEDLIASVDANFLASRLFITVGNNWSNLKELRKQQIANEIFTIARKLDFKKLELVDREGTLLARNPVIGKEMIILHN